MRAGFARVLTLWVAATLAILMQPVRPVRAAEHSRCEGGQSAEIAANSPRRSTLSERGLERARDASSTDELGWFFDEFAPSSSSTARLPDTVVALRSGRRSGSSANARGPPRG